MGCLLFEIHWNSIYSEQANCSLWRTQSEIKERMNTVQMYLILLLCQLLYGGFFLVKRNVSSVFNIHTVTVHPGCTCVLLVWWQDHNKHVYGFSNFLCGVPKLDPCRYEMYMWSGYTKEPITVTKTSRVSPSHSLRTGESSVGSRGKNDIRLTNDDTCRYPLNMTSWQQS